jgi:uncharacterized repeat protein (TIGR01451 family)
VVTWKIGDLKPGESKAVHVTLQGIKNGSSPETDNTAKAESVECVNATDVAKTEIVLPDLSIVKTGEPITVLLNEKAIYYITVANTSKCPATKVTITDKFNPDAFQFVSADPPPNPLPPPTDGEVTWNIGDLKPGESKTVSVTLQAIKESPPGSPWKNTATVTCAEWGLTATPPKTAEFETEVRGCVGLNCDKTEVRFGTTEDGRLDGKTIVLEVDETKPNLPVAIITLDVENEGSYNVEGDYELTVTLLPFIELQGEGSPQFIKPSDREISWRITTLKSGDNKFTFEVKGVQAGRDNIVATLSGNPKKLICNPKCEIPIWVVYSCKLPIYAEPFREIKKDETATFTITITNEGKNTASEVTLNIYLCEKLPSGEIICPASPDYVVIVAPLPPYKIGSMKPGDVRTIEVTLKATVTGTYGVKPEVGYICERQGK